MLKNYFVVTLRNLRRHLAYSAINIAGLAIGIASSALIFLYVWHETNYDTYHANHDRIFRVVTAGGFDPDSPGLAGCSDKVVPYLKENHPEVEAAFRTRGGRPSTVRFGSEVSFEENVRYADNELFDVFTLDVLAGDPEEPLSRSHTAVITRSVAQRVFGDQPAVGNVVMIDTALFEVTAVIEDSPTNTHLKWGVIISWKTAEGAEWMNRWVGGYFPAYVKLAEGTNPDDFETRIAMLIQEQAGEELAQRSQEAVLFLQPISDIHLHSHLTWEIEPPGKIEYVYVFSAVGVLILLIASLNFMNLATARSSNRSCEIGIRKVAGAQRRQLVTQFLGEAVLTSFLGLIVALLLIDLALPSFNSLAGTAFAMDDLTSPTAAAMLLAIAIGTGLLAGIYPALVLSSFQPVRSLKGQQLARSGSRWLRRIVVVAQFTMALILITGTITVYRQLQFMQAADLGFDKEQKLVIELPTNQVGEENYQSFKAEFVSLPGVLGATISSSVPGRWNYLWRTYPQGEEETNTQAINWYQVDEEFLAEYQIEVLAGTPFVGEGDQPFAEGVLLNEAALQAFGWSDHHAVLGRNIWRDNTPVVGVIENFHFRGLQNDIQPLGMFAIGDDFRYLTLRVAIEDLGSTVSAIEDAYGQALPGAYFDYFFLDTDFDTQYRSEERMGVIFGSFTILGLLVACLGLFGLTSFIAEQRCKEIGIRKVLGASESSVFWLMVGEIVALVTVASLIAGPVAYYATARWLEGFAYRVEVGWVVFLAATLTAMVIALFTVGYRSAAAARANPVEALRYE
jgi:putative ABC transport system permease protein